MKLERSSSEQGLEFTSIQISRGRERETETKTEKEEDAARNWR